MAERAFENLDGVTIREYVVAATKVATRGQAAKLTSGLCEDVAAVGDNAVGIFLDSGVAGGKVRIAFWGKGVVKAKVGTGGATAGAPAKYAADGLTNATVGGGTTKLVVCGQFLETGLVGDLVALNLGGFSFTVGS